VGWSITFQLNAALSPNPCIGRRRALVGQIGLRPAAEDVYPGGRRPSLKVRAFSDYLATQILDERERDQV
jgi:hypothetical protein